MTSQYVAQSTALTRNVESHSLQATGVFEQYMASSTTCDFPSIFSSSSADPSASAALIAKQYAIIPCRNNEYRLSYKRNKSSDVENERSVSELEVENGWQRRENVAFKHENKSLRQHIAALKAKYKKVG